MLEWDILSVYPYKEENIQEILCRIYSIVEELKKNGQVVPPELISDIEKIKEEFKVIKGQLGEELQKKIDEALKQLNAVVDSLRGRNSYSSNVIRDGFISDYRQQLTAGDSTDHENVSEYGKCELHVRNGQGTITGVLKIPGTVGALSGGDATNVTLVKGVIATKQEKSILFNTTAYKLDHNNEYEKCVTIPMVLNRNGNLSVNTKFWKLSGNTDCNRYISVNCTFPIHKNYVADKYIKQVNGRIEVASAMMQEKTSSVVIACDSHIRPTENESSSTLTSDANITIPLYINYINSRMSAFATINNGDTLHESLQVTTMEHFKWLMESVRKLYNENTLFVMGNHDDQSLPPDREPISNELFNRYLNKGKTGISFAGNNQPYYTADDTKGLCRHIILNSHDGIGKKIGLFQFGNGQLKWLIEQLNSTPDDYSVVIYCHASPKLSSESSRFKNALNVHEILKTYVTKGTGRITSELDQEVIEFNFTNAKGLLAGVISGHEHYDKEQTIDKVNYSLEKASSPEVVGDEPTYTIALVDGKHRELKLLRGGSGRRDYTFKF